MYRVSSAHEEGGDRLFSVSTERFVGERPGASALELVEVEMVDGKFEEVAGTEREIPADLVLLAMGFTGPERGPLLEAARASSSTGAAMSHGRATGRPPSRASSCAATRVVASH